MDAKEKLIWIKARRSGMRKSDGSVTGEIAMRALVGSLGVGMIALAMGCAVTPPPPDGHQLFSDLCAGCHGVDGKGHGPSAPGLSQQPADLTKISAKNHGVFPRVKVMSWIDGFTRAGKHGGLVMPIFDPLLDGPTVMVETGKGVMTPTPEKLVMLADYVQSLQKP